MSRAAHEKIVADLAALPQLDLPVPPVTLYDRGDSAHQDRYDEKRRRVDSPRYISVSAWAYEPCTHAVFHALSEEQRQSMIAPFSAMRVFEAWIAAGNASLGHVLINAAPDGLRLAWIDHAHSLSQQWEWEKPGTPVRALSWYLPGLKPDQAVMKQVAGRIGDVADAEIDAIAKAE